MQLVAIALACASVWMLLMGTASAAELVMYRRDGCFWCARWDSEIGPIYPKTPACYGFTIIANVKPGTADTIRNYGYTLAKALEADPYLLAPLKLHYLRWVLFDDETRFMYQGVFDTDFDKYTEDAIALFTKSGVSTAFENLEGFPLDWRTNPEAFIRFVHDHHCPSFIEYGEYPYVTSDEIKKALRIKNALSEMLDQLQ
jgi:hypothetical protein